MRIRPPVVKGGTRSRVDNLSVESIRAVRGVEVDSLDSRHFSIGKEYAEADSEVSASLRWVCEVMTVGGWCL